MKNLIKLLHERSGRLTAKHPTAERFDTYKMGRTVAHISTQYTLNTDQGRKGTYYCERTWYFTESIESPRPYVASDKQSVLKTVPANNEMMIDAAESLIHLPVSLKDDCGCKQSCIRGGVNALGVMIRCRLLA